MSIFINFFFFIKSPFRHVNSAPSGRKTAGLLLQRLLAWGFRARFSVPSNILAHLSRSCSGLQSGVNLTTTR